MPSWKKLISSGSAASLSSLTLDTALPVSEGGTGATTLTSNGILTGNGTSAIQAESNLTFNAANGNFSSGDGSESVTHEPSSNYLTVHETGASKGSHLRLSTDNSDFILTAGGGTNQLSLYDVNGVANRLIVTSAGTFEFQQNVDVSGALTLGTALAVAEGGTGATSLNNLITLGTHTTGNYVATITGGTGVSSTGATSGEGITHTLSIGQSVGTSDTVAFGRVNLGSTVGSSFLTGDPVMTADGYIMAKAIVNTSETGNLPAAIVFGNNSTLGSDQISLITSGQNAIYIDSSQNVHIPSGDLRATNDVIAFYSSDKRLKDNIVRIENPLEKIEKIGGYTFDWNDKQQTYTGKDVGVIAQEIQEVLPELVTERDNGYLAVKYEKIVPLLIESIKELKQEVDEIKQKCDCLNK